MYQTRNRDAREKYIRFIGRSAASPKGARTGITDSVAEDCEAAEKASQPQTSQRTARNAEFAENAEVPWFGFASPWFGNTVPWYGDASHFGLRSVSDRPGSVSIFTCGFKFRGRKATI